MLNREIYISCDVETDGPIPGPNSMLSFGAAAFGIVGKPGYNIRLYKEVCSKRGHYYNEPDRYGYDKTVRDYSCKVCDFGNPHKEPQSIEMKMFDTFSSNLTLLNNSNPEPSTEKWWNESDANKASYAATRVDQQDPKIAMGQFVDWVDKLSQTYEVKPVFVAYPAGFDFLWMYWYITFFGFKSPFSFSAIDIKTAAMWQMKCGYRDATKRNMPKHWFSKKPHTHKAIDDAIEQGELFCNMMIEHYKP